MLKIVADTGFISLNQAIFRLCNVNGEVGESEAITLAKDEFNNLNQKFTFTLLQWTQKKKLN